MRYPKFWFVSLPLFIAIFGIASDISAMTTKETKDSPLFYEELRQSLAKMEKNQVVRKSARQIVKFGDSCFLLVLATAGASTARTRSVRMTAMETKPGFTLLRPAFVLMPAM